ncbi:hypothetical protein AMTRI_Chr11g101080 [Amborella trichopoda]
MTRGLRAFKRWMKSHGVEYSDALLFTDGVEGIGVKTLCDLSVGDLIVTIPKSACLTIKTSMAQNFIEDAGIGDSLGLAVALMFELSIGQESNWYGYLQLLPKKEPVPLVWNLEEVDTLLVGTELHKAVKYDKSLLYEDWKECIVPLVAAKQLNRNENYFGVEQYFAAKTLIASRAFEIDEYHGSGMVPLADLFNHKTGAEDVHLTSMSANSGSEDDDVRDNGGNDDDDRGSNDGGFDDDAKLSIEELVVDSFGDTFENSGIQKNHKTMATASDENHLNGHILESYSSAGDDPDALGMILIKNVKAGNEVFNTYGTLGNAALLHRYGFTEPENPFDIVNIDLNLVMKWAKGSFSNRYSRSRISLWKKLGCSSCSNQDSEYFEVTFSGTPQLDLMVLLYIFYLPDEVYCKMDLSLTTRMKVDISLSSPMNDELPSSIVDGVHNAMDIIFSAESGGSLPFSRETEDMATQRVDRLLTKHVCNALISLADIREGFYGTSSLEEDMHVLKGCCRLREPKRYHSLSLRVCERSILKKMRIFASKSGCIRKGKKIYFAA